MKVLITGATGLLGRELFKEFSLDGRFDITGLGFSRAEPPIQKLDLLNASEVKEFVEKAQPDVIIHSAAERKPDISEKDPEATEALNVKATRTLLEAAQSVGAYIFYFSTDYVFDGTQPPYSIDAEPNPLNFYGKSKLEGEKVVLEDSQSIVLRVPVLYGPVETTDESPVSVIAENVKQRNSVKMDHWATRFPTFTPDVASVTRQLIIKRTEDPSLSGIFHWSGNEPMTKYDMAVAFAKHWDLPEDELIANSECPPGAPRPKNAQLDCSRLKDLGVGEQTDFSEVLKRLF